MDNIRNVIKILFRYTSPNEVLSGDISYGQVERSSFTALANSYMSYYSNNEVENLYAFLCTELEWHNNKMRGRELDGRQNKVSAFDALLLFADKILVEENEMPLCCYEHLLRWRDMIVGLEEDLFITAFFAQKDLWNARHRVNFFWPPVIGHNNKSLNRLMAKGVAENHFHLKGSAPTFHLSWISIMNNVVNPQFKHVFEDYENRRLSRKVAYSSKYTEDNLYISYIQAALIRLYLFACLKDDYFTLKKRRVPKECILAYISRKEVPEELLETLEESGAQNCRLADLDPWVLYLPADIYKQLKKNHMYADVSDLLNNPQELLFYLPDIQKNIVQMQEKYADGQLDYMICEHYLKKNAANRLNEVICGERWFMYEIFRKVYSEDIGFRANLNWFYAYILIKENIRAELIQVNGNVGFHNFLLYQERKELFIDNTPFEKIYVQMAVRDTIRNQHILSLEARITPKDTAAELKASIEKNDNYIVEKEKDKELFKERFFYVCHFIKVQDTGLERTEDLEGEYRHYAQRHKIRKQAHAIYNFRNRYGKLAYRLRGIDAASEEIGCRPEVFAQAFRFLRDQSVSYVDFVSNERHSVPDLSVTYHAGEDFLDIVDGLRAIDEAICYLDMRCGDRLGHALALGVDVDEWYKLKSKRILISQMDYLDNLVWLYAKIRTFCIEGCEDVIRYIERRYDEYFRIVYLNNMNEEYADNVIREARKYYHSKGVKNSYGSALGRFSLNTYYDAWKLRGDNPEFYQSGYFKLGSSFASEWDNYAVNKNFPDNYRIRYNLEAAYLYYVYHYNYKVKMEGNKKKEIKIHQSMICAVKKVQQKMQLEIAKRGICIETNPSSNALIGTFKRYDKHPILNWYNEGLESSMEEKKNVPQIQVSINTDDQGVFATYIENEYAYLALALEKLQNENGTPKFSRTLIYHWLDNVRQMGLAQSFSIHENNS